MFYLLSDWTILQVPNCNFLYVKFYADVLRNNIMFILDVFVSKRCLSRLNLINIIPRDCRPENLYRVEDFSNFNSSGDILMGVCTNDNPIQLMLDRNSKRVSVTC